MLASSRPSRGSSRSATIAESIDGASHWPRGRDPHPPRRPEAPMTVRPLVGVAALVVGLAAESGALDSYEVSAPSVFDSAAVDRTGDACGDFYRFACGGWLAKNPLPAEDARLGRVNDAHE